MLIGLVSLVAMPYTVLMPIFAAQILHGNAKTLGILMGAPAWGHIRRADDCVAEGVRGFEIGPDSCASFGAFFDRVHIFALVNYLSDTASAGRFFGDDADVLLEHARSVDGAGPAAGPHHGRVFDDVHGHGAIWSADSGSGGRSHWRSLTVAIGGVLTIAGAMHSRETFRRFECRREKCSFARAIRRARGRNSGAHFVTIHRRGRRHLPPNCGDFPARLLKRELRCHLLGPTTNACRSCHRAKYFTLCGEISGTRRCRAFPRRPGRLGAFLDRDWDVSGEPDRATDEGYTSAIVAAVRGGVNVVDSAINYRLQRSERSVGAALKVLCSDEFSREEIVLCTKAGFLTPDEEMPEDASEYFSREYVERGILRPEDIAAGCHCMAPGYLSDQLDRSRKNLGVECVDVFYLHNPETQLSEVTADEFRRRVSDAFQFLESAVSAENRRVRPGYVERFPRRPQLAGISLARSDGSNRARGGRA